MSRSGLIDLTTTPMPETPADALDSTSPAGGVSDRPVHNGTDVINGQNGHTTTPPSAYSENEIDNALSALVINAAQGLAVLYSEAGHELTRALRMGFHPPAMKGQSIGHPPLEVVVVMTTGGNTELVEQLIKAVNNFTRKTSGAVDDEGSEMPDHLSN